MLVNLDRRIRIERPVATKAQSGAQVITWELVASVYAEIRDVPPSRSESVRQGLQIARNQSRVRVRYLIGLDSSMRVVYAGVPFNIVGGPSELGRKEYHEMVCERYSS